MKLEVGQTAPAFTAKDHTGRQRSNTDFEGHGLVVYFYPKAFTPGCTAESCDFRDRHDVLADRGYTIIGVSPDEPDKLAKFREEYSLPFDLLSDTDRRIGADYDVLRPSDDPFADYPQRISYLIDPQSVIARSYEVDDPAGHGAEVLADLRALQS